MQLPPNVILVGFMGSGKTSTGKELARLLDFQFLDVDQWIEENNKKSIKTIFEESGEGFFRAQEKSALERLKDKIRHVISTGGGAWMDAENRDLLMRLGWCVWLRVSPQEAWKRISRQQEQRPLLTGKEDPFQKLTSLMELRNPAYSTAHYQINTDEKGPHEVALEIVHRLNRERPFDLSPLQK
jgi:shikimate kinase